MVFMSDIHGPIIPMSLFKKYMSDISKIDADFIILGGDITDEFVKRNKMEDTYKTIGEIKNKKGIYYVYGNHDRLKYSNKLDYDKNIFDIIVSSGFGAWAMPFRTESHSEYVVIKIIPKLA